MAGKLYTAKAHVTGGRAEGHGRTSDGALEVDLRLPTEMGGQGGGTNPEQLFAVGYAACFEGALGVVARRAKLEAGDVGDRLRGLAVPGRQGGFFLSVGARRDAAVGRRRGRGRRAGPCGASGLPLLERDARQHRGDAHRQRRARRVAAGVCCAQRGRECSCAAGQPRLVAGQLRLASERAHELARARPEAGDQRADLLEVRAQLLRRRPRRAASSPGAWRAVCRRPRSAATARRGSPGAVRGRAQRRGRERVPRQLVAFGERGVRAARAAVGDLRRLNSCSSTASALCSSSRSYASLSDDTRRAERVRRLGDRVEQLLAAVGGRVRHAHQVSARAPADGVGERDLRAQRAAAGACLLGGGVASCGRLAAGLRTAVVAGRRRCLDRRTDWSLEPKSGCSP